MSEALKEAQKRRPYDPEWAYEQRNEHYRLGFMDGAAWKTFPRWEDPCPNDPQGRHNTRAPFVCDLCGAVAITPMAEEFDRLNNEISRLDRENHDKDTTITFLKDWLTEA